MTNMTETPPTTGGFYWLLLAGHLDAMPCHVSTFYGATFCAPWTADDGEHGARPIEDDLFNGASWSTEPIMSMQSQAQITAFLHEIAASAGRELNGNHYSARAAELLGIKWDNTRKPSGGDHG